MSFYKTQELSETFNFNKIRSQILRNFQNFTLKFINGDSKSKQIYKVTETEHFLSLLGSSKNKQIN